MSDYSEKTLRGDATNSDEWRAHLIEAHQQGTGMTPAAFADCFNASGQNSYDWLANAMGKTNKPQVFIDLACGDGFLIPILLTKTAPDSTIIGIDMSEAELSIAEQRKLGANIRFYCRQAEATGLGGSYADVVFCHMALMLMLPVDPIVHEVLRVLKPGGRFAGVVGSSSTGSSLFAKIEESVRRFLKAEFPQMAKPVTGDVRFQSEKGLRELLGAFEAVTIQDDCFTAILDPMGVWEHIKSMYIISSIANASKKNYRVFCWSFSKAN